MRRIGLVAALVLLGGCHGGGTDNGATSADAPLTPIAAPQGGEWTRIVTQTPEGGMLMGNPAARVRVVEFSSMTCPHCARFAQNGAPKLVADYVKTGQVSFELRNFVRDPLDITMALVTRCAGATPQFFALTDAMFRSQTTLLDRVGAVPAGQLQALADRLPAEQFRRLADYAGLPAFAAAHGLTPAQTSSCLASKPETDRLVQMNSDAVTTYRISGTPTFLINNEVVDLGEVAEDQVWDALQQRIRKALA